MLIWPRFLLGREVADVHHDGEPVHGGFREREGALAELHRVHRGDGEAEGRQRIGGLADGDAPVLQAFEKRALRLERYPVDLVEQNHFGRCHGAELRHQGAGGRVDHLEADHFRGLEVGAALDAGELGVADGGENHAEEGLADTGHTAQQEIARVDLTLFVFVVGRRNF